MKKILIFGAMGNIGKYLVEYLKEKINQKEYEIIPIGRRKTEFFTKYDLNYFQVDITKKEDFDKLPQENVYAIILLAAVLPAYMEGYQPEQYIKTNIIGAFNVLEYSKKVNIDRILYPQTESDLSGYWEKEFLIKPNFSRKFNFKGDHAIYTITKNTAVDLIEHYHQTYGIKNFIFRCPTIYCYTSNPYFYVNGERKMLAYRYIIERAMNGEEIEMWGDPTKAKDIVYIKDFCQMLYKALFVQKIETGIYNVGTGVATTLKEQIEGIIEVFSPIGKKSKIKWCPEKPNSRNFVMDITNAKKELGYEPEYYYIDYLKELKKEMKLKKFKELEKNYE